MPKSLEAMQWSASFSENEHLYYVAVDLQFHLFFFSFFLTVFELMHLLLPIGE